MVRNKLNFMQVKYILKRINMQLKNKKRRMANISAKKNFKMVLEMKWCCKRIIPKISIVSEYQNSSLFLFILDW